MDKYLIIKGTKVLDSAATYSTAKQKLSNYPGAVIGTNLPILAVLEDYLDGTMDLGTLRFELRTLLNN